MAAIASVKQDAPRSGVKVTYDCFAPLAQSVLRKPQGPLPLQTSTTGNLEWASAFLDHAAHLIKTREQKYEELAKQYNSALNTISHNTTDIQQLKKENHALDHKIEHLHADVARQATAYKRLDEAFDHFRSRTKAEKGDLTKNLDAARRKLNAALSNVKSLETKLIAADKEAHARYVSERLHDVEDHKALEDLRLSLEAETKANATLQDQLDQKIKELLDLKQKFQAAKDKEIVSEKDIVALKEQIEKLKQCITSRDRTIGRQGSDLEHLRLSNATLTAETTQLSAALAQKTAELQKASQTLSTAQTEAAELKATLVKQATTIQELSTQIQDQKDQNATLSAQSEKTTSEMLQRINELIKHDEDDEQKLAQLTKELEVLSISLQNALADDESDKAKINNLTKLQKLLQAHDSQDEVQIEKLKKALAALEADLKNAAEQKKSSDIASNELKKQVETLQQKITEVTSDDVTDKDAIKMLKEAKEAGDKAIEDLKAQNAAAQKEAEDAKQKTSDSEAQRKSAEAAAEKAAREHDETHKPILPNDVKLAHPIALVGSLKGAPRSVDDETFYINCSFPVTLFSHSSNKIYISSNGLLTLDHASVKYDYQKFPCRGWIIQPLPDHVLAPFWADLYIYKNTPQGIYYEETGEKPKRKLEVEWYVSRYQNAKQYYHFSIVVEEAKPNLVTFKYFEALDKGGKCTIGVQGPKTSSMFSYDEQKALPGTMVTFDTAKNTFTASTFKIQAAGGEVAVNGSKVQDVKPANGVKVAEK